MQKDNRQHVTCRRAFTLIELILVVGMIGLVTGALVGVVGNSYKDFKAGSDRSTALQDGQAAIDQMTRFVRGAKSVTEITTRSNETGYIEFQDADGITKRIKRSNSTTNEVKYGEPGSLSTLIGNATHLYITGYTKSGSTTTTERDIRALQFELTLKDASSPFVSRVSLPIDHVKQSGKYAVDSSGNGRHGKMSGCWQTDEGRSDSSYTLYFNGTSSRLYPPTSAFAVGSRITIAFWATCHDWKADGYFLHADSGKKRALVINVPWNNRNVIWQAGGNYGKSGYNEVRKALLTAKKWNKWPWHHWAFTKHAGWYGGMHIYMDGVEKKGFDKGRQETYYMNGIDNVRIGGRLNSEQHWKGKIDDFRVYSSYYGATDIGKMKRGEDVGSPLVWYKFEEIEWHHYFD